MDGPTEVKQKLLFVTHQVPAFSGSGTRMRAGRHIQILAETFDITLAVVAEGLTGADGGSLLADELHKCCVSVIIVDRISRLARLVQHAATNEISVLLRALWATPVEFDRSAPALALLAKQLAGSRFDVVHCFRLDTGRIPKLLRKHNVGFARSVLDFDAYESEMAFRTAGVASAAVGRQLAAVQWLDSAKWAVLESRLIPSFDDVYVCSELDRSKLTRRFPRNRWHVVPNIVFGPATAIAIEHNKFTFLFVGLLNYPPNADAIVFFCKEVLPILRHKAPSALEILVVGRGPSPAVTNLVTIEEVRVIGDAPDLVPYYARADVVIVPLRAGGGTRVKVLEAFSYGVPVICTTTGAEGLDVTPETDVLIADDAEAFARQCQRIWLDNGLRRRIAAAGRDLWQTKYSPAALRAALVAAYEGIGPRTAKN